MIWTPRDLTEAHTVLAEYGLVATRLEPPAHGLINTTWLVDVASGPRVVLQRLHPTLPAEVNLNLDAVTTFLATHGRMTPRLVRTPAGAAWISRADATWRLLTHVEGRAIATLPDRAHAVRAGRLLGDFHAVLDACVMPLPCQRPAVHQPARHRAALAQALAANPDHPLRADVAELAASLMTALDAVPAVAEQPLRLLHGDPKLSNLLFDSPGCLVDLDTLVRAPLAYELGDALRSWCNPQAEDAALARFDLALMEGALSGYADATREFLLPAEAASIVAATATVCLELAMRFAADALNERYFGWDATRFERRGEHNLRRARNQFALAQDVCANRAEAAGIVARLWPGAGSGPR
jgi:Ser/Thr protein kinase RdoA (MazF antagonist)